MQLGGCSICSCPAFHCCCSRALLKSQPEMYGQLVETRRLGRLPTARRSFPWILALATIPKFDICLGSGPATPCSTVSCEHLNLRLNQFRPEESLLSKRGTVPLLLLPTKPKRHLVYLDLACKNHSPLCAGVMLLLLPVRFGKSFPASCCLVPTCISAILAWSPSVWSPQTGIAAV